MTVDCSTDGAIWLVLLPTLHHSLRFFETLHGCTLNRCLAGLTFVDGEL